MAEYKDILEKIVASDDDSINQVYGILNRELDFATESRIEYIEFAERVRSDLSKCLDNPNLTLEEQREIREQEMEILRMADKKDSEIRKQEVETAHIADKKDSEKRAINWKVIGAASIAVLTAVGIGASALGGNFNVKLPKKS